MALVINSNVLSLTAQRSLSGSNRGLATSIKRLSTGLRINSAKDDAAGLAIANRLEAELRGLGQAARNANDAISVAQTAEGAMSEASTILLRMRDLSVQAASDSNSASDRANLQKEITQLTSELDRISNTTAFNGQKLLDGTFQAKSFHIGAFADQTISVSLSDMDTTQMGSYETSGAGNMSASTLGQTTNGVVASAGITISGKLGACTTGAISANAEAVTVASEINGMAASTGVEATAKTTVTVGTLSDSGSISFNLYGKNTSAQAISASVASTGDLSAIADSINSFASSTGVTAAVSGGSITLTQSEGYDITIEDYANSTTANSTVAVTGSTGSATTLHDSVAANDTATVGGSLTFDSSELFSVSGSNASILANQTVAISNVATVNIGTQTGANSAINVIDGALQFIDDARADLGAIQNRLESTVSNLDNVRENVVAARSRVMDADFATETAMLTKFQIIQQAGIAMLGQANAVPQAALALLQ